MWTLPHGKVNDKKKYEKLSKYILSTFEEFVKKILLTWIEYI
jgi:hypothetical protein